MAFHHRKRSRNGNTRISGVARLSHLVFPALLALFLACNYAKLYSQSSTDGKNRDEFGNIVRVNFLHINDVYEIQPISKGRRGGLARLATLREDLLMENPNTYTVIAGDFFSPSALGTAKVDGEQLNGKQTVAVLNAMGLDYAVFGNHEFDLEESDFKKRLAETKFKWISSNVRDEHGNVFPGVSTYYPIILKGRDSKKSMRIILVGVTTNENDKQYVSFKGYSESVREVLKTVEVRADVVIAITHLDYADDQKLAEDVTEIDLILGGHDHENMLFYRGDDFTPILKADANATSAYVHRLTFNLETKDLKIQSELIPITDEISEEPSTDAVVQYWIEKAFKGFEAVGFQPREVIANSTEPLDGLESSVRNRSTNLTRIIADGILQEGEGATLAMFNSGSIRIDDVLQKGPLTQYDVLRMIPFEGKIFTVDICGSLLNRALSVGHQNKGKGSFLQTTDNVDLKNGIWTVDGVEIVSGKKYKVAINDYLATGKQRSLEFINVYGGDSRIKLIKEYGDIRIALINELKKRYP